MHQRPNPFLGRAGAREILTSAQPSVHPACNSGCKELSVGPKTNALKCPCAQWDCRQGVEAVLPVAAFGSLGEVFTVTGGWGGEAPQGFSQC